MGLYAWSRRFLNKPDMQLEGEGGGMESLTGALSVEQQGGAGNTEGIIDIEDIVAMESNKASASKPSDTEAAAETTWSPSGRMLLRSLMDSLGDYVYFKDRTSRYIEVNKAFANKVLSLSDVQKAVGRTDFDFFQRDQAVLAYENEQRIMSTGEPEIGKEVHHRWPDGHVTWLITNTYPLHDDQGCIRGIKGIWRDISEKKHAEDKLRSSEEMLGQAQKMEVFGKLAGGIAHDFNNMINVILGSAQLIELSLANGDPDMKRNIATVIDTAKMAADLTQQLLTFARKGKCNIVELDAHEVIRSVVSLIHYTFDKRIRIVERLQAPLSLIKGDYLLLQNALLNLCLNARDAMPDGGTLTFATDVVGSGDVDYGQGVHGQTTAHRGSFLRITIADTGTGMDEMTKHRAFEPFFTTKPEGKGTGLGLVNVYGTIRNLGGLIDFETTVNKGTTFSLYLPLIAQPIEKPFAETEPKSDKQGARKVLVVDDEKLARLVLVEMLSSLGYASEERKNGDEAIELYRDYHNEIDVIILDLVMPGINSSECIKELKRINPSAKIVISSIYNLFSDTQQILSKGIAGFLQKPFDIGELADILTDVLRS
jgi:two-component system cell cycle sensor histidine kinase/response regulator CckA